jgi:hypothetical protein
MAMSLPTFGLLFLGIRRRGENKKRRNAVRLAALGVLLLIALLALAGCGGHPRSLFGGGNGGTPVGAFPITVTASSANASAQTTITLTVTP